MLVWLQFRSKPVQNIKGQDTISNLNCDSLLFQLAIPALSQASTSE